MRILVCGGAGFIGSNFIRRLLRRHNGEPVEIVNLDKLTYAGNPDNLRAVEADPRYRFICADICDRDAVMRAAAGVEAIVNFAAETHVDRSIVDPEAFLRTDILGIHTLLEVVRELGIGRMVQVSTDEVYGSVQEGSCAEDYPLSPTSPYSAAKAGGDLQVFAYYHTYGVPAMITRGSNTYGPYQYPEKLIPLFVTNALEGLQLPLYGDGLNVRDWLHVDDHCAGIEFVLRNGEPGQVYNVGGGNERTNLEITGIILDELGLGDEVIRRVPDRPGHDRRYSLDCGRLARLGWRPQVVRGAGDSEPGTGSLGPMSAAKRLLRPGAHAVKVLGLSARLKRRAKRCESTEALVELAMRCEFLGLSVAPMQVEEELVRFIDLVRALRVRRVLEIGTARGGSLFLLCQVCSDDALLVSADLPEGDFGGGYPRWRIPLYRSFAKRRQHLRLIRGDSHALETLEEVRDALGGLPLDLLFIDGDHSYDGVSRDFADYSPLVREGGMIAMHDVVPGPIENVGGTPEFWSEIAQAYGGYIIKSETSQGCYGIGVIPEWKRALPLS